MVQTHPHTLALWLNTVLGYHELSAPALARRLGMPATTVQGWLLGTASPSDSELLALADALDIRIEGGHPGP